MTTAPPRGHLFQPGQSGNPSGRPSTRWFRQWLDEAAAPGGDKSRRDTYMQALFLTAIDRKHRNHVDACRILSEYDMGKPVQAVEHTGADSGPLTVNFDGVPLEAVKALRERLLAAGVAAANESEEKRDTASGNSGGET